MRKTLPQRPLINGQNNRKHFRVVSTLFLSFFLCLGLSATTYISTQNGNWNSSSTWGGGSSPGSSIGSSDSVLIYHVVSYNLSSDLEINGYLGVDGGSGTADSLFIPDGRKITVNSSGEFFMYNAAVVNNVVNGSSNGSGSLENKGGLISFTNSYVEFAQDWSNDGGINYFSNGTFKTGQNYSSNGTDTLDNVCLDLGLHGSGNFQFSSGSITFLGASIRLNGSSGSFELNSGTVSGNISAIQLVSSGGDIKASTSVSDSVTLSFYCLSGGSIDDSGNKYRNEVDNCTAASGSFPCNTFVPPPIPVELINFYATEESETINLHWSTATEINNDRFEILRKTSKDNDFIVIGTVAGVGSSFSTENYSFIDSEPRQNDATYYQLKQIDFDGAFELSKVLIVKSGALSKLAVCYPNPVTDHVTVTLADNDDIATVILFDGYGRELSSESIQSSIDISTSSLKPGIYFIKVYNRDRSQTIKIFVNDK
ncbi:MAG: hypothetical protein COA58_03985 [Bacteroidetes bacterium]|nr:MAG: hypothetical protein COA58_03985 [Bacteroidota bacterium]